MANNDYITTDCKLTVSKNTAKLDEEIFLYKNDRNIKLLIEIVDNKYRYKSDDLSNLLVKYKASYAQVKWYKNAEVKKEFPIQATDDGKVVFVIEGELINEDTELGDYDLQLRLLNESQESIRSLPIIKGAVHILKPLFEEGDIATVNSAVADVSMLSLDGDAIDTYNSDGTYNQTNWGNGDVISSAKLNKLEKVAKDNVDKVNKMPAKSIVEGGKIYLAKEDGTKLDSGTELPAGGTGTSYDDTEIKTDINTIKTDLGTAQLTTTAKTVKGAVNEVAAQYKEIANNKADKNDLQVQKSRIDNLATLKDGSTTGDAELIDGRIGADGITYDNIGGAIRGQMSKKVTGIGITKIMTITQQDYDYSTKDPNTLYIISDTTGGSEPTQQLIPYLKNTGGNSYIDTGYVPKLNSKFELTVRDTSQLTNNRYFGNQMFDIYYAGTGYIGTTHSNKYAGAKLTNVNSKHTYIRNSTELYVDGQLQTTVNAGNQVDKKSLYIFGKHLDGDYSTISAEFTFFELKIYEDDKLIHHYMPRKNTDNVACIFDVVTQQYLYNSGTGTLEYGTELKEE